MQDWPAKWSAPVVSVRCTTYNHEPYIAQALDSFLAQKTNFPFEVVVHDDASTDKTADIVREYEMKYPQIIKPIYETENQYSKRDGSLRKIVDNACKGKYIAFCEGDDFWSNENKLQKQYDFIEKNPSFSACAHNTNMINLVNGDERVLYSHDDAILQTDFFSKEFHFNSLFCKRDVFLNRPIYRLPVPGDIIIETYLKTLGPIFRFGDVMSVYRCGVAGSWTKRIGLNKKKSIENSRNVLAYYEELKKMAPDRLQENISLCIEKQKFLILRKEGRFFKAKKDFPERWKELSLKRKIYFFYDFLRSLV